MSVTTPVLIAIALAIPIILVFGLLAGARFTDALNARPRLFRAFAYVSAVTEALIAIVLWYRGESWWFYLLGAGLWLYLAVSHRESPAV